MINNIIPVDPTENDLKPKQLFEQRYKDLDIFKIKDYGDATKFSSRLRGVHDQIKKSYERADRDFRAFIHDRQIHPQPLLDHRGCPLWNTSKAKELLCRDMDLGKHKRFKPMVLWYARPEFQEYPLEVFRKHIHQEAKKRKKRPSKKKKVVLLNKKT